MHCAETVARPGSLSFGLQHLTDQSESIRKFTVKNIDRQKHGYRVTGDDRYSDFDPAMTDIQTICVYDYHQVKSISGNTVTFFEPIMHEVEAKYGWQIREFPHYENVGIEVQPYEAKLLCYPSWLIAKPYHSIATIN